VLLVHDLMLLLLDDESGKQRPLTALPQLLAGALLVELAAAGVVDVDDRGRLLRAAAPAPTEPLLADATRTVEDHLGKKPDRALRPLGNGVRERAVADLVGAGILTEQKHKTLGLFPTTRHPAVSTAYEDELRARVTAVLEGQVRPDHRTGPVIALLQASGALPKIVPVSDRKRARTIAKEVSEGNWAAASVRRAVKAAQSAAIAAATTAATSAAITS
jgi:hypothetical protein